MNYRKILQYLVKSILLILIFPMLCYAQGADFSWARQQWVNDEQPYIQAETIINNELLHSTNYGQAIIDKYKSLAMKDPKDKLSHYKWGYAVIKASHNPIMPYSMYFGIRSDFPQALLTVDPPYSYHYMRMLFLLGSKNKSMRWLGEKLIKKNPNDYPVISTQISVLSISLMYHADKETKEEALRYARYLIKKNPKKAYYYTSLAEIYEGLLVSEQNKEDAKMAIKYYNKYLKMANPNETGYTFAKRRIPRLEGWIRLGHWPDINGQ